MSAVDIGVDDREFLEDVIAGLHAKPKRLSSKYFYDKRGSELFDEICGLDEYYLTRTETQIIRANAGEICEQLGRRVMLVELGSGSSTKTRILLDHLTDQAAYVPVDVSGEHLYEASDQLQEEYTDIDVIPVCGDFMNLTSLPVPEQHPDHVAVFFPGSTIGNFSKDEADRLLQGIANLCGVGGGLLIGIDLQKDVAVMEAAYNDERGVTAEFNVNLLRRINRELGADFHAPHFQHLSQYNERTERIETFLVSQCEQTVCIDEREVRFDNGERINTEYSHKYTVASFTEIAQHAGFSLHQFWTDPKQYFAVLHLVVEP